MIDYINVINGQLLSDFRDDAQLNENGEVRDLISQIRAGIATSDEQVGVWEMIELNSADRALDAGFSRLALIAATQALVVSYLSPEAYTFGLRMMHTHIHFDKRPSVDNALRIYERQAQELLQEQRMAAQSLLLDNQEMACDLKLANDTAANALREAQIIEAALLRDFNIQQAQELRVKNEKNLQVFQSAEMARSLQQSTLVYLLSASSDGYSSSDFTPEVVADSPYVLMCAEHEQAACVLKLQQEAAAEMLEQQQLLTAATLKATQAAEAEKLYKLQLQTAEALLERQAIEAIRKKSIVIAHYKTHTKVYS